MPFFTFYRALKPRKGSTPGATFLRGILLIAVFAGVAMLYSRHFEKTMDRINTRSTVYDQTGEMSPSQRDALRDFAAALQQEFGIELRIQVRQGALTLPETDAKTLFIGLDLANKQAVIILPPLLERALDPQFVLRLRQDYFAPALDSGDWPQGLSQALRDLGDQLAAMRAPTTTPPGQAPASP